MRPITKTYTLTGVNAVVNQTPIGFDYFKNPCNISIGVVVNSGSSTYTLQHTFDDIYSSSYSAATGNWFNYEQSGLLAATVSGDGNYAFPPTASRLSTASGSSGVITCTWIQAG